MSFYTSLTGLKAAQSDLATVSNNVANVNSTAFKKSRTNFGDIFAAAPMQTTTQVAGQGTRINGIQQQFTQGTVETTASSASSSQRLSPIELTQKEYLDAYNEYVRLLRESGPQTIETLQALAIYQKKYQIYQMLLKAGGQTEKTENTPWSFSHGCQKHLTAEAVTTRKFD